MLACLAVNPWEQTQPSRSRLISKAVSPTVQSVFSTVRQRLPADVGGCLFSGILSPFLGFKSQSAYKRGRTGCKGGQSRVVCYSETGWPLFFIAA